MRHKSNQPLCVCFLRTASSVALMGRLSIAGHVTTAAAKRGMYSSLWCTSDRVYLYITFLATHIDPQSNTSCVSGNNVNRQTRRAHNKRQQWATSCSQQPPCVSKRPAAVQRCDGPERIKIGLIYVLSYIRLNKRSCSRGSNRNVSGQRSILHGCYRTQRSWVPRGT